MKSSLNIMKVGVVAIAVAVLCLAGLASDKVGDNAKAYQGELETMKGQAPLKILSKIAEWQFEPSDVWMAENPTAKDLGKHNLGKVKFSKQEIKDVFGEAGHYKVAVYRKLVGTSQATLGSISDIGMSTNKDATFDVKIFTVVRLVFREDKLVNVRTWPKLERSTMSGGNSW